MQPHIFNFLLSSQLNKRLMTNKEILINSLAPIKHRILIFENNYIVFN
jgi:hypothetical protein